MSTNLVKKALQFRSTVQHKSHNKANVKELKCTDSFEEELITKKRHTGTVSNTNVASRSKRRKRIRKRRVVQDKVVKKMAQLTTGEQRIVNKQIIESVKQHKRERLARKTIKQEQFNVRNIQL